MSSDVLQFVCQRNFASPPTLQDVMEAITKQKNEKVAGTDGIPMEFWKHGGETLFNQLHTLINLIWSTKHAPQEWRNCEFILIHKGICSNC